MRNEVPAGFEFRTLDAGPRRDVAREFFELVEDLAWLPAGVKWDVLMSALLVAREKALLVAEDMVRS